MESPQIVLFASKHQNPPLWRELPIIPAYLAALSALAIVSGLIWRSLAVRKLRRRLSGTTGDDSGTTLKTNGTANTPLPPSQHTGFFSEIRATIRAHGAVLFFLRCLRLASCLALLALTIVAFVQQEDSESKNKGSFLIFFKKGWKHGSKKRRRHEAIHHAEWIELVQSAFFLYASLLALLSLTLGTRMRSITSTHLIFLLLAVFGIYVYRDLWPLATFNRTPADTLDWLNWSRIGVISFASVLLPLITPREYVPLDPKNPNAPNSEQTASPLSFMLFSFLDTTVYNAWKHPHLPYELLPSLADYDRSTHLRAISRPTFDPTLNTNKMHMAFKLLRLFSNDLLFMAFCMSLRAFLNFLSPIAVNRLLSYIERHGEGAVVRPWVWIILLFISPFSASILFNLYIFTSTRLLVRTEGFLTQLIFEHALRIRMKEDAPKTSGNSSNPGTPTNKTVILPATEISAGESIAPSSELGEGDVAVTAVDPSTNGNSEVETSNEVVFVATPVADNSAPGANLAGRINNLIGTDLENITESRDFMFLVINAPLQIGLCIAFLYTVLGVSALVGMGIMVLGFYFPGKIAQITHHVQVQRMKSTDERMQAITETMGVLRMIKQFGWEKKIGAQVREKREKELGWIRKRYFLNLLNNNVNYILPLMTMVATFAVHTLVLKHPLSASTVFSALTVFDSLRDQFHFVFWTIPTVIQGKVSMDRIDEFLEKTELLDEFEDEKSGKKDVTAEFTALLANPEAIGFHNATFKWSREDPTSIPGTPSRRNFTLRIPDDLFFKRGQFNIITGPTGSGKTSLLFALLGEMHFAPPGPDSWFNLPREKGVAYAAQEPWVLNETVKQNIIFGPEDTFDAERYRAVITQCGLESDLSLFSAGDATEIGEKGLTLSGGQKARISLARAVYSRADIVLLDDVLSALDVHTARWVVDKCFAGHLLRGRTVILVTHNVAMAGPLAKNVVEFKSDGSIVVSDTIGAALSNNKATLDELVEENEVIEKAGQVIDGSATESAPSKSSGKLIADEEIALGRVSLHALMLYVGSMGGPLFWASFWTLLVSVEFLNIVLSWWLGVWAHQYELMEDSRVRVVFYLGFYAVIILVELICYSTGWLVYMYGSISASRKIHERLVTSILSTTLRFLDRTPVGRIIARFTKDIRAVDGPLSEFLSNACELTALLLLKLAAIVYFTPIFLWPGLAFGGVSYILGRIYISAQLSIKREMSNARSPVFSHFEAAMGGLTSIRAYGVQEQFKFEALERVDKYTRPSRAFYNMNRWIGIRVDALGGLFAAGLAAYLLYVSKSKNASETGLQINLAVAFTGMLIWWVRTLNELEVAGNSLERIDAYLNIEQEPAPTDFGKPSAAWPTSGELVVNKLTARYSVDGPDVLHSLSFSIKSGEKVGVVGRTGSGKSSLTLSLLRLIPTEGEVRYDGVLTSSLNLEDLRGSITIIPQQPELLSGTIRQNLDPFEQHDDATLNDSLRASGLFNLQSDLDVEERITLESPVSSGGSNFSLGQRQILALARALVRQSKILILDEATASLDHKTDTLVQESLKTEFKDCTLITVAHRLQTIMNSDKIIVLDQGSLLEFDSPRNLMAKEGGLFKSLVDESGDKVALLQLMNP